MFPAAPAPVPLPSFSSTFRPASSDEDDDNDTLGAKGFCRFKTSSPTPSISGRGSTSGFSHTPFSTSTSTPLPHGGVFHLVTDLREMPSSAAGTPPGDKEDDGWGPFDEELDMGLEADDEADGDKEPTEDAGDKPQVDPGEVELLKGIIKVPTGGQPHPAPKSGNKRGSTHLDGGSSLSDLSGEDLDTCRGTRTKKKTSTPTKALHPSQWTEEDIDVVRQIHYKTDLKHFQTYRTNKIAPADIASINTNDHSAYLEVA